MKISDQIGLAVTNLSRRKGRTALTVVGVVVGICAVIVMISMGIAESHNNDEMLKNMGGLTKIEVYNYGSQTYGKLYRMSGENEKWNSITRNKCKCKNCFSIHESCYAYATIAL